jgi:hypothetical protein
VAKKLTTNPVKVSFGEILSGVFFGIEQQRLRDLKDLQKKHSPDRFADLLADHIQWSVARLYNDRFNEAVGRLCAGSIHFKKWWNLMNHQERQTFCRREGFSTIQSIR